MTITELEEYFHGIDLPRTVKLNEATTILNVDNFLETTFLRARGWKGASEKNPSIWHLIKLHDILEYGDSEDEEEVAE